MANELNNEIKNEKIKKCGIVMPIAGFGDYTTEHWSEVKHVITKSATKAGFETEMVSYKNQSDVIHTRIIDNLFNNEIVVVDVSGKNPNVMFELGMRLAFDKPTVVIKDDITDYSFDTAPIDHLGYSFGLKYNTTDIFMKQLTERILGTYNSSFDTSKSGFLRNFGFTISKLGNTTLPEPEFIFQQLEEIKMSIQAIEKNSVNTDTKIFQSIQTDRNYNTPTFHQYWQRYLAYFRLPFENKLTDKVFSGYMKWLSNRMSKDELDKLSYFTKEQIIFYTNNTNISYL